MSQYVEGPDAGLIVEDHAQLIEYFLTPQSPEQTGVLARSTNCSACHAGVAALRVTPASAALSIY